MKIGFVNIVPWRGHDTHTKFLMECAKAAGLETHFISCNGGRSFCYQKLINKRLFECINCKLRARQVRKHSDLDQRISITEKNEKNISKDKFNNPVISSVGSSLRLELDDWTETPNENEKGLLKGVQNDYNQLARKLKNIFSRENYSFLFIFNGRFHDTAAAVEAARELSISFATHERAWFGSGLQVNLNTDCLSNRYGHFLRDIRFKESDELDAISLIERRISSGIPGEWKTYNQSIDNIDLSDVKKI